MSYISCIFLNDIIIQYPVEEHWPAVGWAVFL